MVGTGVCVDVWIGGGYAAELSFFLFLVVGRVCVRWAIVILQEFFLVQEKLDSEAIENGETDGRNVSLSLFSGSSVGRRVIYPIFCSFLFLLGVSGGVYPFFLLICLPHPLLVSLLRARGLSNYCIRNWYWLFLVLGFQMSMIFWLW